MYFSPALVKILSWTYYVFASNIGFTQYTNLEAFEQKSLLNYNPVTA